jgi:8-oxo-dGTP diphosphatase
LKAQWFKNFLGQDIYLTFNPDLFSPHPNHVLVLPFYQGSLLFTLHSSRGWEVPGGKIEPGERPAQAAAREVWEETGANLKELIQIGEYRVTNENGTSFSKAIFAATVERWGVRPDGFETIDAALFPLDVDTTQQEFSPYMKDGVFSSIQRFLRTEHQPMT